jgi:hypothetical protein
MGSGITQIATAKVTYFARIEHSGGFYAKLILYEVDPTKAGIAREKRLFGVGFEVPRVQCDITVKENEVITDDRNPCRYLVRVGSTTFQVFRVGPKKTK